MLSRLEQQRGCGSTQAVSELRPHLLDFLFILYLSACVADSQLFDGALIVCIFLVARWITLRIAGYGHRGVQIQEKLIEVEVCVFVELMLINLEWFSGLSSINLFRLLFALDLLWLCIIASVLLRFFNELMFSLFELQKPTIIVLEDLGLLDFEIAKFSHPHIVEKVVMGNPR